MKNLIVFLTLIVSTNAFAVYDLSISHHAIIRRIARTTGNTGMISSNNEYSNFMLEQLKDPTFRSEFIDEALNMELQLQTQLLTHIKNRKAQGLSYKYRRMAMGGPYGDIEFSTNERYDILISDLHILNDVLRSTAFMSDTEFQSFSKKIINHLQEMSKVIKETNSLVPANEEINFTLLQYYLLDVPDLLMSGYYRGYTNKEKTENLKYSKNTIIRKLQLLSDVLDSGFFPAINQEMFAQNWDVIARQIEHTDSKYIKATFTDKNVVKEWDKLLSKLKTETKITVRAQNLQFDGPICSNLFR